MEPYIQPAPAERPRRRTFMLPTFGSGTPGTGVRTFATLTLVMALMGANAQTQPVPDPPSPPGVPSNPLDPEDRRHTTPDPQGPATPQSWPNDGWTRFDDHSAQDLGLQKDQLQRLRDVDQSYQKDYSGLGNTPSQNPGYRSLSDRRNADVKDILTPAQYERWMKARPTTDEHMDHEPDGGMKKDGNTSPGKTGPGTVKSKTAPATTPAQKPTTAPKN